MANINETIAEVEKLNPELAKQLKRYVKDHSYGLVFEQNLPDSVRLWTKKPAKYDKVNILPPRGEFDTEENYKEWYVSDIVDGTATLVNGEEVKLVSAEDIVPVVGHKDVIYPGLKVIDKVERGNADDPYHMVINAENYHALEALVYAYAGKVDCIYIDPPYNKEKSKDWKYNCNYVDVNDKYRHSKWLSMMERRLILAKKLLNPNDSVMIITIDETEYLHLGMLLEQMFPEAKIQMVSITISPSGAKRDCLFSRSDEYIFFLLFGDAHVVHSESDGNEKEIRWFYLRRTDFASRRGTIKGGTAQFYPIYVDNNTEKIVKIGEPLPHSQDRHTVPEVDGATAVFPVREDGVEMNWGVTGDTLQKLLDMGFVQVSKGYPLQPYIFKYISTKSKQKFDEGRWKITGERKDGSKIVVETKGKVTRTTTVWQHKVYDAGAYGTSLLNSIIGDGKFSFPKSLYAVIDTIKPFVSKKPNSLIIDFFAGSGTTLHAVNILNALDGGKRRCVLVTNNEVGETAEKNFIKNKHLRPYDTEWQNYGIARYVTWTRTKCSIEGNDVKGQILEGDYGLPAKDIDLGFEMLKSKGFKTNAIFCELTYENLWDIRLDRAFNAVAPILWMLAGCKGPIIEKLGKGYATTCNYAVLFKYDAVSKLVEALKNKPSIEHVFVVTDDQQRYLNVINKLNMIKRQNIHRLYESYLRSFEIVGEGGLD